MGINNFIYGKNGLALTKQFEGCRLTAYQDQVGVWTIGYGHTGGDVRAGLAITEDQAEALLVSDVAAASAYINSAVLVALAQNEFDALVDFVFNLGRGAFAGSTLLKKLNAGDFATAANQFAQWDHAGGQVVAGLLRRRQAEAALFQESDPPGTAGNSGANG
jgi:lysozyme